MKSEVRVRWRCWPSAVLLAVTLLILPATSYAQGASGRVAVLRALDKVTGKTRDIQVGVGKSVDFGSLKITVRGCQKAPEYEAPENAVFLEVFDRPVGSSRGGEGQSPSRIFSGWMYSSVPALNGLEHAVYDVWAIECRI